MLQAAADVAHKTDMLFEVTQALRSSGLYPDDRETWFSSEEGDWALRQGVLEPLKFGCLTRLGLSALYQCHDN